MTTNSSDKISSDRVIYPRVLLHAHQEVKMKVTKILQIGRRQTVRLPESFRFNRHPDAIKQFGHDVQLPPIENLWGMMREAVNEFETGFQMKREEQGKQRR